MFGEYTLGKTDQENSIKMATLTNQRKQCYHFNVLFIFFSRYLNTSQLISQQPCI